MAADPQPAVVLHVDNDPLDLLLFETAASKWHACFIVHGVNEIPPAKDYLLGVGTFSDRAKHPFPVLLLLDYSLNGSTGADFLRWVRHQPSLDILVISMFSGADRVKHIGECYQCGANYFLLKPRGNDGFNQTAEAIYDCLSLRPPSFNDLRWLGNYRAP
jgi:DNA-binding NarL/FixJ family response regulator